MRTYMVSYDLNRPGQNYADLIEELKGFGTWWHHLTSTWLVRSALTPAQIRDTLKAHLDPNDELLVIDVHSGSWASFGFSQKANGWLRKHL